MFGFLDIKFIDILDIALVAFAIFYLFKLLRGSQAIRIVMAIMCLYVLRVMASALNMKMVSSILGTVLDVGIIALIVIFQPEIRRFLLSIGNSGVNGGRKFKFLSSMFGDSAANESMESINEICKACEEMSEWKCGALIVIRQTTPLGDIVDTGDVIDAKVSKRLLENLFFKNSPLHDGAVIISDNRVVAARCTLPITEKDLPAFYGMRHKAAVGISESTDAKIVTVSEETGGISFVRNGHITRVDNINDLKLLLQNNE